MPSLREVPEPRELNDAELVRLFSHSVKAIADVANRLDAVTGDLCGPPPRPHLSVVTEDPNEADDA